MQAWWKEVTNYRLLLLGASHSIGPTSDIMKLRLKQKVLINTVSSKCYSSLNDCERTPETDLYEIRISLITYIQILEKVNTFITYVQLDLF